MFNKLLSLFATGAPGLTRLVFAALANVLLGAVSALPILTDLAFVIALSMLFSLGFSILLMKDESRCYDESVIIGSYLFAIIGSFSLFILYTIELINFFQPSLMFFLGLIGYQNLRHINLRLQKFAKICSFELLVWLSVGGLLLALHYFKALNSFNVFYAFALPFLLFSIFQLCTLCVRLPSRNDVYSALQQGSLIGATNLLTGGLLWILPKISEMLFYAEQVTIIANLAFLLGLFSLLPRTILNRSLPQINTAITSRDAGIVNGLNSSLYKLLWLLLPVIIIISILYNVIFVGVASSFYLDLFVIVSLACFCSLQFQTNLINSTILTLLKKNYYTLKFNFFYIVLVVFSLLVVFIFKHAALFERWLVFIFYISLSLCISFRNYLLSDKTKNVLAQL